MEKLIEATKLLKEAAKEFGEIGFQLDWDVQITSAPPSYIDALVSTDRHHQKVRRES